MAKAHFIFYVKDQKQSTEFYRKVFARDPDLNVPGMTEFVLTEGAVLGLMPESGIIKLLGRELPDPSVARGTPRSELYLTVDEPQRFHQAALASGARELSPLLERDWGDRAAYCLDPDGHVLVFAERIGKDE